MTTLMIRRTMVGVWRLLMALLCSGAYAGEAQSVPLEPGPSVKVYSLSDADLDFHKPRALAGDPDSGHCLAMHFAYVDIRNPQAEYWITVAAENGDGAAMLMLAIRLAARSDHRDVSRAKFWKRRAAQTPARKIGHCQQNAE